jgi:hypothetical protein
MDPETQRVLAIGSVITSIITVCFAGIRLSRCTKIQTSCCTVERDVVEEAGRGREQV